MARIVIEGLPCAGKSLLIKELESRDYDVVHELGRVISKDSFPGNGTNNREIKKIDEWFIKKEAERMKTENAFFDRSYLTHLTYAFAYESLANEKTFVNTVKRYQDKIESVLPIPDTIIYVSIEPLESIARQENKIAINPKKALPWFWRDISFLKRTARAYTALLSSTSGINIISLDARLDTTKKAELVLDNMKTEIVPKIIDVKDYIYKLK